MKKRAEGSAQNRHVGIRWRLFCSIAAFTVTILIILWVFQIRLLGYFYQREKFSDMNDIAGEISARVEDENLDGLVQDLARDGHMCIRVFAVEEQGTALNVKKIADADMVSDCVIHHLNDAAFLDLYENAKRGGGSYEQWMSAQTSTTESGEDVHVPVLHPHFDEVSAVHAKILQQGDNTYLVMLDCELSPVGAVIRTLEVQFFWIAGVFLVGALLLSFLLSRMVALPLTAITQKARGLATGDYEPDFSGKGYLEVQELAEALNFAASEIGATDRLQKDLIANISHDLRTPLTMIKGYSEMMRDIPGENSPENVQAIIDEATRLSELVSDLMDLSKLQSGTQKPVLSVFDLSETVRDTMQRYERLIRHEGYQIACSCEGSAWVKADRTMILQVIYNLINNAVNYTGESKRVSVHQTVKNGCVRFEVADDGEGIPPERIPEIWDPYYRVDKVHKRAVMGTGLGLSIVKGVLEAHHATYGVDSAVGVGSVFWFELPLCDPGEGKE